MNNQLSRWTCPICGEENASDLDLLDSGMVLMCVNNHKVVANGVRTVYAQPTDEAVARELAEHGFLMKGGVGTLQYDARLAKARGMVIAVRDARERAREGR